MVSLGCLRAARRQRRGGQAAAGAGADPRSSWVGGVPRALSALPAQCGGACDRCGAQRAFATHVFAPVDAEGQRPPLLRALHIFLCPGRDPRDGMPCCVSPAGWRVLRSQRAHEDPGAAHTRTAARTNEAHLSAPVQAHTAPTDDDQVVGHGNDKNDKFGGGDDDGDDGGEFDFAALLAARDASLKQTSSSAPAASSSPAASASPPAEKDQSGDGCDGLEVEGVEPRYHLREMVVREEPPVFAGWEDEDDFVEHTAGLSDDHILQKLEKYMSEEQEDERDATVSAAVLRTQDRLRGRQGADRGATESDSAPSGRSAKYDEEAYEEVPEDWAALLRFQKRLQLEPQQVLRYDYGGEPLWATPRPPRQARSVPPCACGQERVFECQLMPALAEALTSLCRDRNDGVAPPPPPPAAEAAEERNTAAAEEAAVLTCGESMAAASAPERSGNSRGNGDDGDEDGPLELAQPSEEQIQRVGEALRTSTLDWATVAIYVCPTSCTESREECVVVQPAP